MRILFEQRAHKAIAPDRATSEKILHYPNQSAVVVDPLPHLQAQNTIHVTGRVLSDNGQPVAQASVVVKGEKTGVSTDEKGNFDIVCSAECDADHFLCRLMPPPRIKVGGP